MKSLKIKNSKSTEGFGEDECVLYRICALFFFGLFNLSMLREEPFTKYIRSMMHCISQDGTGTMHTLCSFLSLSVSFSRTSFVHLEAFGWSPESLRSVCLVSCQSTLGSA